MNLLRIAFLVLVALLLCLLLPLAARALPITVDPAGAVFTGTYAVEWNGSTLDNWTATGMTATVSGGLLSGTTSGTDPQLTRTIPSASRPDLDLGFNDFIELRMQVPATFAGDIQIYYGTTATTGFGATRVITIPNATIPKDGAFHVYRIDVGPEPWWRATLRDLRVDPGSVSGVAFAIDYLRVGDLPGDVYLPNTTDQPVTAYELSSKHFRFIWDANRATNSGINATVARGCLRNAEEAWQTYVKLLGYREPAETMDLPARNGSKYKVNFLCIYDGFWMGGSPTSFGYLNIDPSGLQVDPPTLVTPHELMHVFQMHNTSGHVPGEWWETHANYGRERWLYHYANLYPSTSNLDAGAVRDAHFMMSSGRNYYLTWLPFLYIDENPDALPDLYDGLVAKMWQETQAGEFSMMALDRLTPTTSLKDIVGYYARRGATLDYAQQATLTATLNGQDPTRNARHIFTDLVQRADNPTWWRVPPEKAPAQGAYAIHQLVPAGSGAGRVVTVNLHGLGDATRGADWRASFIAVSDTGVERYTPLWSAGSSSITLAANENTLYLSVAGTPDVFHYGGHDEALYPFRSHPSRSRFHYEVQVTGATPRERNNGSTAGLTQHANGGGYKASTSTVAAGAYLGPNARVLGNAVVSNTARIEDYAVVADSAQVRNNAVVSGHAWVRGTAVVQDFARVRDWAIVDSGTISGNARALEHATVGGSMQDTAVAKGSALHQSGGTLSGNAIVDGDYMFNKSLTGGVTFGHLPYVGIPDNFTTATPTGLYAAYDFKSAHDSRALDQYGITDGFTTGSPAWTFTDGKRKGFLTFNGSSQSIALDRSVADSRAFTFAAWVKPAGGAANQAVLWLGASSTRRLYFTPNSTGGPAKFAIVNGGAEQTLTAAAALPVGVWSHVAVTLDGTTGTLYVDGSVAASGPITIRPDELLGANTTTGIQHNYLARSEGSAMPMFQGALDDAQFFSSALSAAQLTAATTPPLSSFGSLLLSDSFNSESYSSGEFNNTLAADQQGLLAPNAYAVTTGGQGWHAQHGNGGTMLLVGDAGFGSRASLNEDFSIAANGLNQPLSFQMDASIAQGSSDCWSSITLGRGQNLIANSVGAKFGILPKPNGNLEIWVNGSQAPLASHSGNTYRIVLSDTAGTGSAFNGNGSKAVLFNGATLVGTYPLPQLVPGDGFLTFGAQPDNGYNITRIDNLSISRVITTLTWQGDTDSDFNTASNYLDESWGEWANYVFDSNVVSGSVNVDANAGWGNIALNSGLGTDIVIGGANPILMAPGKAGQPGWAVPSLGGTISIAPDSANLTINTSVLSAGGLVWNVGAGRTLIANGSVQDWAGQGVAASLEKQGAGTAVLTAANSYTGATTIGAGTLALQSTYASSGFTVASGAALELNVAGGQTDFASTTFSGSGTLRKTGAGGAIWGPSTVVFALGTGALIDVQSGSLTGGSYANENWSANLADLNVASGAAFHGVEANVRVDALSGAGTISSGYPGAGYAQFTFGVDGGSGTFSGVLADGAAAGNFVKTGAGTQTLSGVNTFTGTTTIAAGKLALSGSLASSALTASGGTFSPVGNVGTTGSVSISGGGRFELRPGSDTLTVGGSVTLGGALDIFAAPGLATGTAFTILNKTSAGAVSGPFAGKANGSVFSASGYDWLISYTGGDGNDVTLTTATAQQSWRFTHFGTVEDTGNAADAFDANGDGELNLMEFATGQNPNAATNAAPALVKNGATLELTYTLSLAALSDGVTFTVEWSDTLAPNSWSNTGVTEQLLSDNGIVQTVKASAAAGSAARRYLHLRVSKP